MGYEIQQAGEVAVVLFDGKPVFTIDHRPDQTYQGRVRQEFVVAGLEVKDTSDDWNAKRHVSVPTTSNTGSFDSEPTAEQVLQARQDHLDWAEGYSWVKWSPEGAEIPADATEAWHKGVRDALQRWDWRGVEDGKITGKPSSY